MPLHGRNIRISLRCLLRTCLFAATTFTRFSCQGFHLTDGQAFGDSFLSHLRRIFTSDKRARVAHG